MYFKYPHYHRLGPSCRKGLRVAGKNRRDFSSCKGVGNRTAVPFPENPNVSNEEQRRRPVAVVATRHENPPETLLIKDGDWKRKTQANRAGKGLCVDRDDDDFHIIYNHFQRADFCLWPSDGPLPRPSIYVSIPQPVVFISLYHKHAHTHLHQVAL